MTMTIDHPAPASPPSARPGRASRFPAILGAPADSAERLAQVRVIVAGCGSVGLNVVSHLARMIRALMCIDSKNIKTESLQTHPVTPAEIGLAKVRVAATWAARVNPEIEVRALDGLLGQQSPYDLLGYDYLVAAVDNLRAELEANDISRALGIPLIRVSVHGETLSAQVQFFSNQSAETPCPGCVFGTRDWAEVESLRRYACDGSERPPAAEIPTMSIPSLCSLAADLCVHQLLRDVLGIGRSVRDSVLSYSAISHRALVSSLPRAPDCRASHRVLRIVPVNTFISLSSPEELLASAGLQAEKTRLALDDQYVFVDAARCSCGRDWSPARFMNRREALPGCPCGGASASINIHTFREVPVRRLEAHWTEPLASLGADSARYAILTAGEDGVLVHGPRQEATP